MLEQVKFQDLITFRDVVNEGSLTAVGNKKNIAKSIVSSRITRLEKVLNLKLFNRETRSILLTREGRHLLHYVESLIHMGNELMREVDKISTDVEGDIKITAPPEYTQYILTRFLPCVRDIFPKLKLIFHSSYNIENMHSGKYDLAFRNRHIVDDRLVAHKVGTYHNKLYVSPNLKNVNKINDPENLNIFPLLGLSEGEQEILVELFHQSSNQLFRARFNEEIILDNLNAIMNLSKANAGICYVPNFVAYESIQDRSLIPILPNWTSKPLTSYMVFHPSVLKVKKVNAVINLAKQYLPTIMKSLVI